MNAQHKNYKNLQELSLFIFSIYTFLWFESLIALTFSCATENRAVVIICKYLFLTSYEEILIRNIKETKTLCKSIIL